MARAVIKDFFITHGLFPKTKFDPKVWRKDGDFVEKIINMKNNPKAIKWIVSDDTGTSSKVIWAVMMGVPPSEIKNSSTPSDVGDFGRCYRLLKLMPEWEQRLDELRGVKYQYHLLNDNTHHTGLWDKFVDNYSEMCRLYEAKENDKLYKLMRDIF